jgi:hypothetical protein
MKRKTSEECGIDQAVDSSICSDSKRDGQDGGQGEPGRCAKDPDAVVKVLQKCIDEVHTACFAAFFLSAFETAEFDAGATQGFVARDAVADLVLGVGFDMEAEFGVHVPLNAGAV